MSWTGKVAIIHPLGLEERESIEASRYTLFGRIELKYQRPTLLSAMLQ